MRPVCILPILFLLLFSAVAYAENATLSPGTVFEGSLRTYNLTLSNLGGTTVINAVDVDASSFSDLTATDYLGWDETGALRWENGTIENNVLAALFSFDARAPIVSGNTTHTLSVDLESDSLTTTLTVDVLVVDDLTAASLSSPNPPDGLLLSTAVTSYNASIIAVDSESGVASVTLSHAECGTNQSATNLAQNGSLWETTLDFSSYTTSTTACFSFDATNHAGLVSSYTGNITFDGTAPSVTFIAPNNSTGASATVVFNASDDLAPVLSCSLFINDAPYGTVNASSGNMTSVGLDLSSLSDGLYEFKVTCADSVGWESSDSQTIMVDATAPSIVLNSPSDGSSFSDALIDYSVTDANGVASVVTSADTNTSSWPEGTQSLTINATDLAGNIATASYTFTVDRTAPSVVLDAPFDGSQFDTHVNFTFTASDALDSNLSCVLSTDNNYSVTTSVVSNTSSTTTGSFPLGNLTWSVTCTDDAGNAGTSGSRAVQIVDLSGPDLSSSFSVAQRGFPTPFLSTVTDPSGVDTVLMTFESSTVELSGSGDLYSGSLFVDVSHTLGNYTLNLWANDTNGFVSTLDIPFTLVKGFNLTLFLEDSYKPNDLLTYELLVQADDGSNISGENVTLADAGANYTMTDSLNDSNMLSDSYQTSFYQGYMNLTARYEANGFAYTTTHTYANADPASSSGNNGFSSSGSSGRSAGAGDGPVNRGSGDSEGSGSTDTSNTDSPDDNPNIITGGEPPAEVIETPSEPAEERQPLGTGQATGVFNLGSLSPLWWVLLALIALLLGLFIMSRYKNATALPKAPVQKEEDLDWDDYFDRK